MTTPTPSTPPAPAPLREIWAWAGHGILTPATRVQYVQLAQRIGLTDLVLTCNDNSQRMDWHLFRPPVEILSTCLALRDVGIRPHLMSWAVGSREHCLAAGRGLLDLARLCHPVSVMLDAEERWILKGRDVDHAALTGLPGSYCDLVDAIHALDIRMGTTGIVFTDWRALEPLTVLSDYVVPQAYSFPGAKRAFLQPGALQREAHKRWAGRGAPRLVMGLAGWKQDRPALGQAVEATEALGVSAACYWSLAWLKSRSLERAYVSALCSQLK